MWSHFSETHQKTARLVFLNESILVFTVKFTVAIDPSSHPPFDCDLPMDIPSMPFPANGNGQGLMSQLSSRSNQPLAQTGQSSQGVISAAVIMSNIVNYEHAIEAVLQKAASGQDLGYYLVEIDSLGDLDSIPPETPKSSDLNMADANNQVVDQTENFPLIGEQQKTGNEPTSIQSQVHPTAAQMAPPQTMSNPALVVRTGPHQQVPAMPASVQYHGASPMGMHGRPTVWGYDAGAPSPHGAYILASPGDPGSMGFPHDPVREFETTFLIFAVFIVVRDEGKKLVTLFVLILVRFQLWFLIS